MKPTKDSSIRAAPQAQLSRQASSSSQRSSTSGRPSSLSSIDTSHEDPSIEKEKRLPLVINIPYLLICVCVYYVIGGLNRIHKYIIALFAKFHSMFYEAAHTNLSLDNYNQDEIYRNENCSLPELPVLASPGLTTLLDTALYQAHEAELVPTTCAASQLLQQFLEMKEASALVLRECRWMAGVPFVPLELEEQGVAVGSGGVVLEDGRVVLGGKNVVTDEYGVVGSECVAEDAKWNEFDTIQDFALQCFGAAKEAIHRLTTDRLAESANLTLQDSISSVGEEGKKDEDHSPSNHGKQQTALSFNVTNAEIGRCYNSQPRSECWESPRLYCPDYSWADDVITCCQRLLRNLSKHKLVSLIGAHGWNRYIASSLFSDESDNTIFPPTYASCTPHPFPSLEAAHALKYLLSDLLITALPSHLNQFRAGVEANAVVSKRLYLVKCEYRAPIRAHMESWLALKAAPKLDLVERYLKEFHGVGGDSSSSASRNSSINTTRRKNSNNSSTDSGALQKQRDHLEQLIAEKWKHPSFLEALQLERLCERLEMEMSQILLPLTHVATEIMDQCKGRIRAVAAFINDLEESDMEDNDDEESVELKIEEILGWRDIPHMRECLKCLKSILCRKPGPDESSGIRPLLLDLQGVPRKADDSMDLSMDVPFCQPPPKATSSHLNFASLLNGSSKDEGTSDPWYYLEQFIRQVEILLKLIDQPDTPFLISEDRSSARWQELVDNCVEVWDSDLFRAQYQDWFDMVTRQKDLNSASDGSSLSELSESIREAEIELSIAMASRDQLELVRQRLEALVADKNAKYQIMAQIVNDVALRELNENIVVLPTSAGMSTDFPKLSAPGVFGNQMLLSAEVLPIG